MTVVLTPHGDMDPVPRVEIVVEASDLPAGTDRVTFWRVSEGHSLKVRDGIDRTMVASVSLIDLEPGRGASSTYEAECWDGTVSLGRIALGTVFVPWVGATTSVLVQQPLDPHLSLEVHNLVGSWPDLTQDAPGEAVYTEGDSLPTVVGFGPRTGFEDVTIDFGVSSREDAARLRATLGTRGDPQVQVWLIRGGDSFLPRVFFCHVKRLVEVDINNRLGKGWSRFRATVTECKPPAPALVVSLLSYDDLDAGYTSYTARDAAYASYDLQDRDYSLAGLAG